MHFIFWELEHVITSLLVSLLSQVFETWSSLSVSRQFMEASCWCMYFLVPFLHSSLLVVLTFFTNWKHFDWPSASSHFLALYTIHNMVCCLSNFFPLNLEECLYNKSHFLLNDNFLCWSLSRVKVLHCN